MNDNKWKHFYTSFRTEIVMMFIFILFFGVMSFLSPQFGRRSNVLNVLSQMSVVAFIAIGQTFVIISAGIDLSVGAIVALSGIIGGMCMKQTGNALLGIAVMIGVSLLVGVFNGFLIGYIRLPPFIATLGTQSIARSLTYVVSDGNSYSGFPKFFSWFGSGKLFGFRYYILLTFLFYVFFVWLMLFTKIGRFTYAIGSNREGARLSGINVRGYTMVVYILCGFLCGIAAITNSSRLLAVDPTTGVGLEMDSIAAVVIGGASMAGGKGSLVGTLIGVLLYTFLRNALNLMGINPFWQGTATGIVIIVAVLAEIVSSSKEIK